MTGTKDEHSKEDWALIAHLQSAAEREKASLACALHDELGGLILSAIMDVAPSA